MGSKLSYFKHVGLSDTRIKGVICKQEYQPHILKCNLKRVVGMLSLLGIVSFDI